MALVKFIWHSCDLFWRSQILFGIRINFSGAHRFYLAFVSPFLALTELFWRSRHLFWRSWNYFGARVTFFGARGHYLAFKTHFSSDNLSAVTKVYQRSAIFISARTPFISVQKNLSAFTHFYQRSTPFYQRSSHFISAHAAA
ncbi:hypothetical protein [Alkalibacillus haloalkaliphilus]|uniref:hypothetical protein n=1 Tax=Alkalibacillus haloalkaliphilus TaxID=94136 RepID=UPI001C3FA3C9|nr:hypothetical protein [Alkalibacillus haloalkaliphilus]